MLPVLIGADLNSLAVSLRFARKALSESAMTGQIVQSAMQTTNNLSVGKGVTFTRFWKQPVTAYLVKQSDMPFGMLNSEHVERKGRFDTLARCT